MIIGITDKSIKICFFEGIAPAATAPASVRLDLYQVADYNEKILKCKDNLIEGTNNATIGSEVLYGLMPADKAAEFQAQYCNAKTPLSFMLKFAKENKNKWDSFTNVRTYIVT